MSVPGFFMVFAICITAARLTISTRPAVLFSRYTRL